LFASLGANDMAGGTGSGDKYGRRYGFGEDIEAEEIYRVLSR